MTKHMSYIAVLLLLSACGMNKTYNVTGTPSGSVVSSGNVVYGTTPFTTDLNTILPNRQWDAKPSASRLLKFEKDGYLLGSYVITEFGEGGNVHVDLTKSSPKDNDKSNSVVSRLEELKKLTTQG